MKNFTYVKPADLEELLDIKRSEKEKALLLAGGTNLMVYIKEGKYRDGALVHILSLEGLRGIREEDGMLDIGACETMEALLDSQTVASKVPFISASLTKFANPIIRTMSTLGGNIADGSPIADQAPVLLALEGQLICRSAGGERTVPIDQFFTGPGETTLKDDEVVTRIRVPVCTRGNTHFEKLGLRKGTSCSVASAAVWVDNQGPEIQDIRIALGGVAPTPVRAKKTEKQFTGKTFPKREDIARLSEAVADDISPISDVRGTADYRREVAAKLLTKAVAECLGTEV